MRPVTLHPYVARRAPPKSVPTVQVDVHVVPGHMHTPCLHGVEGAAAVEAREGGSDASDVVAFDIPVALRAALAKTFSSLAAPGHVDK